MTKPLPNWRREVEGTDHGRTWAGVGLGALVTFLFFELRAIGPKVVGDTLSEAVWSVARPFRLGWWLLMPPLLGLFGWLWPHFAFRWGDGGHLLGCIAAAYLVALVIYLIVR